MNVFIIEGLHNEVLHLPEILFRKGLCTQSVLVGNHHEFVIQLPGYSAQVLKHLREEDQLFKFLYLEVICFKYKGAIAVDKQYFFLFHAARS